jgi:hypothetical protein
METRDLLFRVDKAIVWFWIFPLVDWLIDCCLMPTSQYFIYRCVNKMYQLNTLKVITNKTQYTINYSLWGQ